MENFQLENKFKNPENPKINSKIPEMPKISKNTENTQKAWRIMPGKNSKSLRNFRKVSLDLCYGMEWLFHNI